MTLEAKRFQKNMTNPIYFWWAMIFKLPTAIFWKLRINMLTNEVCQVTIPYSWRSQNPYQSIYFAALAGAAELSTGALCHLNITGKAEFSMLVVDFRAEYFKKANQTIIFTCNQGKEIEEIIDKISPGESDSLVLVSSAIDPEGELIAEFYVTWSFMRKN